VFETYTEETFNTSRDWIAERDIFESGDLGRKRYEEATISVM
jgi:hypothetical protein